MDWRMEVSMFPLTPHFVSQPSIPAIFLCCTHSHNASMWKTCLPAFSLDRVPVTCFTGRFDPHEWFTFSMTKQQQIRNDKRLPDRSLVLLYGAVSRDRRLSSPHRDYAERLWTFQCPQPLSLASNAPFVSVSPVCPAFSVTLQELWWTH